jgi:hypothetical protein
MVPESIRHLREPQRLRDGLNRRMAADDRGLIENAQTDGMHLPGLQERFRLPLPEP